MNTLDLTAAAERAAEPTSVDCIGIALELEDRAKTVESQTTQRAMLAGARALRNLYARPPLAAPPASEPLNPPTAWDLQHRGASTEPRNGTSASEPQAVRNVDDLRDAGADAEQAAIDSLAEPQFDFARAIHYPEHWDMAAYPTLESAIWEALSCAGCSECKPASEPQAEPQPEAIPIAPVEVVRQALKELLESISECRMDQVTARFAKASVMARAVVDRYKDAT